MKPIEIHIEGYKIVISEDDKKMEEASSSPAESTKDKITLPNLVGGPADKVTLPNRDTEAFIEQWRRQTTPYDVVLTNTTS